MDTTRDGACLSPSEEKSLTERLRLFARGNQLHWGDEEAAAILIDHLKAALDAERDRANRAEALAENWRNDSREETEQHLVWKARAELAETRLHKVLEYAESTYTASTVARRIVQMGKATA